MKYDHRETSPEIETLRIKVSQAVKEKQKMIENADLLKNRLNSLNKEEKKLLSKVNLIKVKTQAKQNIITFNEANSERLEKIKVSNQIKIQEQREKNIKRKAKTNYNLKKNSIDRMENNFNKGRIVKEQRKFNEELVQFIKKEELSLKKEQAENIKNITNIIDIKRKVNYLEKRNNLRDFLLFKISLEKQEIIKNEDLIKKVMLEKDETNQSILKVEYLQTDSKY